MICPSCHEQFDGHMAVGKGEEKYAPEEGDLSMCMSCGGYLVYTEGGQSARVMTVEEFVDLPIHIRRMLSRSRKWLKEIRKRRRKDTP